VRKGLMKRGKDRTKQGKKGRPENRVTWQRGETVLRGRQTMTETRKKFKRGLSQVSERQTGGHLTFSTTFVGMC